MQLFIKVLKRTKIVGLVKGLAPSTTIKSKQSIECLTTIFSRVQIENGCSVSHDTAKNHFLDKKIILNVRNYFLKIRKYFLCQEKILKARNIFLRQEILS